MSKGYHIDTANRRLIEIELPMRRPDEPLDDFAQRNLKALQDYIGGPLEAVSLPTGDYLLVDEEGTFKPQRYFFRFRDVEVPIPYAGQGLIVGGDKLDETGEFLGQNDVRVPYTWLAAQIIWMDREQADAMAKANANEPALSIRIIDPATGQLGEERVLRRIGQYFEMMPRATDEPPIEDEESGKHE